MGLLPDRVLDWLVLLPLTMTQGTQSGEYSIVIMVPKLRNIADRVVLWFPGLSDPRKLKKYSTTLVDPKWEDYCGDFLACLGFREKSMVTCNSGKTTLTVFP